MPLAIIWHDPRPSGVRMCEFQHAGQCVEIKAAVCVQSLWKGELESPEWLADRDAWAQEKAQAIADRMDYEASAEGLEAKAQEEYDSLANEIQAATDRRAELKSEYPNLVDSLEP